MFEPAQVFLWTWFHSCCWTKNESSWSNNNQGLLTNNK